MVRHFQDQVVKDCGSHLGCFLALGKASCHVMSTPVERPTGRKGASGQHLEVAWKGLCQPQSVLK